MSNWFVEQRLEWIRESVRVFGYVNRQHVMKKFGISMPQASKDLGLFQKRFPGEASYNLSAKRFEPPPSVEAESRDAV